MAADRPAVQGRWDARFEPVAQALEQISTGPGELGAAVALAVEGRPVVDIWCGWADAARSRPWRGETLVDVFSVGKAIAALCVLMLVSRGSLDLDQPVAAIWPRFAQAGKEQVTVRQVLGHRAGLAAIAGELPAGALYDWDTVVAALAAQEPWWAPGSGHGYHVHTFGFLTGELVRRVTGESIGVFLRRQLAEPLGAEISFGLERSRRSRAAHYAYGAGTLGRARALTDAVPELRRLAYSNPPGATGLGTVDTPAWMDAELPSANAYASARAIARVYAALLDPGSPLVDRDVLGAAANGPPAAEDLVLGRPSRFGLGFQLTHPERPLGPGAAAFGHFGAGGSLAFADPETGVAFAYVMNRGGTQWQDSRNRALVDAVYRSLAS